MLTEECFGDFLEPEKFTRLRTDLAELRDNVLKMQSLSKEIREPNSEEERRICDLQLLLTHIREQNKRAKMILDLVISQTDQEKSVSAIPVRKEIPLSIEIFNKFSSILE